MPKKCCWTLYSGREEFCEKICHYMYILLPVSLQGTIEEKNSESLYYVLEVKGQ